MASIVRVIQGLGQRHADLVGQGIIPAEPPVRRYEDSPVRVLHIEDGLSLEFSAETDRLTGVYFDLALSTPSTTVYQGVLPSPFDGLETQEQVRAKLGQPVESKGPMKAPAPLKQIGGFDVYRLASSNSKAVVSYLATLQVKTICFMLDSK